MDGALVRYRILAWMIGVGLFTLVFIGIPLQYGAGHPGVDKYVGAVHGVLYIVYLVAALDLARRARFSVLDMLMMVAAGLLPILAFVIERRITASVRAGVRPWRRVPVPRAEVPH
jgi:integral membrane protein